MNTKNAVLGLAAVGALVLPGAAAAKTKTITYSGPSDDDGQVQVDVKFKDGVAKRVVGAYASFTIVCQPSVVSQSP